MQSTAFEPSDIQATRCDRELIQAALAGDQSGYEGLTARYQDRLFRSVLLEVGCNTLAEDIVQDTFVRAFLHLKSFRQDSSFYTWLYRIAINARRSYHRQRRQESPLSVLQEASYEPASSAHEAPARWIERVEECREVHAALQRLDESHRSILILREFEGFDYQSIADVLEVKIGTVRSRLSRAREQLRSELASYLQAGNSAASSPSPLRGVSAATVSGNRIRLPR